MYRISYEKIIKALENDYTKRLIGDIDVETISSNCVEALFYEFPLIERITLEIYKMLPMSDVEHYQQGVMRTILEIVRKDTNNYFPENLINILQKYFGDDGIRNKLFHPKDTNGNLIIKSDELDFQEIKFVIMQLVSILRDTYGKYNINDLGKIELI